MATHPEAIRNGMANYVVDQIDDGGGAGFLLIQTAGDVTLATLTFAAEAFGDAAVGVATANTIVFDADADSTGTATKFIATDSNSLTIFEGTVGATGSGEDLELDSTTITTGDKVSVTSFTYTTSL